MIKSPQGTMQMWKVPWQSPLVRKVRKFKGRQTARNPQNMDFLLKKKSRRSCACAGVQGNGTKQNRKSPKS